MADRFQNILASLRQAEQDLLAVLAQAATRGDYKAIDRARKAASGVRQIMAELIDPSEVSDAIQNVGKPSVKSRAKGRTGGLGRRRSQSRTRDYPRFTIKDDSLHKVGWSRKSKRSYTHRISWESFRHIVTATKQLSSSAAGPVATEQILEEVAKVAKADIPVYQVYVAIAFLRHSSTIRQVGRGDYLLPGDIDVQAQRAWNQLRAMQTETGGRDA